VATDVAIALALSWKPLVKSKNSAVTITIVTMNNVVDMEPRSVRRARPDPRGWPAANSTLRATHRRAGRYGPLVNGR